MIVGVIMRLDLLPSLLVRAFLTLGIALSISTFRISQTAAQGIVVSPSERVTRFVYVRRGPSGNSTEIARMRPGERLPLVRTIPLWYEVRLNEGRTGFVSKSWTVVTPA